jgi:hypothetical protein
MESFHRPEPRLVMGVGLLAVSPVMVRKSLAVKLELRAVTVMVVTPRVAVLLTEMRVMTSRGPVAVVVPDAGAEVGGFAATLAQFTVAGGNAPGQGLSWPIITGVVGGARPKVPGEYGPPPWAR